MQIHFRTSPTALDRFSQRFLAWVDDARLEATTKTYYRHGWRMLKKATGAKSVELASEEEFQNHFPECETGAMPPFGNLYGVAVFADESLAKDKEIAFNAGTHRELIRLAWEDFEKLAKPRMMPLVHSAA